MADLIQKIDGFVFDLNEEGYSDDEVIDAMLEYIELIEDLRLGFNV